MSFSRPNGTTVPDEFFDYWLPRLTDTELRVLLYVIRRTFGFKRYSDLISFRQFREGITTRDGRVLDEGCGVKNKTALARALDGLVAKDLIIIVKRFKVDGDKDISLYAAKVAGDMTDYTREAQSIAHAVGGTSDVPPHVRETDYPGTPSGQGVVRGADIQPNREPTNSEQQTVEGTGADAPPAAKPRRPSLKTAEPHIYEAREAIKARYLSLNELEPSDLTPTRRKYIDGDAEALARKCAERGDAMAAIQAVWDEQWSNGTYPNRDHRLLKRTVEKLAQFRRGELTPRLTARPKQQPLPAVLTYQQAQAGTTPYCRQCRMNAPADHKPGCKSGLTGPVGAKQ